MQIVFQNKPELPNRVFRYIKWKLYGLSDKFKKLLHVDVHIKSLSNNRPFYEMVIKFGIKGHDIVIKRQAENLTTLFNDIYKVAHMQLAEMHRGVN